jgi:hypothetical protein
MRFQILKERSEKKEDPKKYWIIRFFFFVEVNIMVKVYWSN